MATLEDEILRATGGPTVNDGLAVWFGKTSSETLQDAERRFLLQLTGLEDTGQTINDLWMWVGIPGTINDIQLRYWSAQL